jgi:hypothetical protein
MRVLWSAVVVCLVALSGAGWSDVGEVRDALGQRPGASLDHGTPVAAHALAPRLAPQAAPRRARAPVHRIPPVTLAEAPALPAPCRRAIAQVAAASDRVLAALVLTHSARGPPIA